MIITLKENKKEYNKKSLSEFEGQEKVKKATSADRFQIKEITTNPISACNTYESRGTGLGCRC